MTLIKDSCADHSAVRKQWLGCDISRRWLLLGCARCGGFVRRWCGAIVCDGLDHRTVAAMPYPPRCRRFRSTSLTIRWFWLRCRYAPLIGRMTILFNAGAWRHEHTLSPPPSGPRCASLHLDSTCCECTPRLCVMVYSSTTATIRPATNWYGTTGSVWVGS